MHDLRRRLLKGVTVIAAVLGCVAVRGAEPGAEIVVAIRYLQQTGTSHAHLYLYREDGKLLRQLTRDEGGQDRDPIFAQDGETIVFTRDLPGGAKQWWSVKPHGDDLRRLDTAPSWYVQAKPSPSFADYSIQEASVNGAPAQPKPNVPIVPLPATEVGVPRVYPAPENIGEIVATPDKSDDPGAPDAWEVTLRRSPNAPESKVGHLPGYSVNLLSCLKDDGTRQTALLEGPLRLAFLFTHLNSTDGDTIHALDFSGKRLVQLSPNWAEPFPLPGEAAFLTLTEERYLPFGDGKRTANCSYVDRWDAKLSRVRYAREKAPAVCYGTSMYRPGKQPQVINASWKS